MGLVIVHPCVIERHPELDEQDVREALGMLRAHGEEKQRSSDSNRIRRQRVSGGDGGKRGWRRLSRLPRHDAAHGQCPA